MFTLLGIRPFFVTTDELFCSPGDVVRKIAGLVGLPVNEVGLERALELSAPYGRDHAKAPDRNHVKFRWRFRSPHLSMP